MKSGSASELINFPALMLLKAGGHFSAYLQFVQDKLP